MTQSVSGKSLVDSNIQSTGNDRTLMRTKYCIRHQLGLCPRQGNVKKAEPLFLRNGKERLQLTFDCAVCEMTVS